MQPIDSRPEDSELVARAQSGESACFEELVRRHRGTVVVLVTHHLGKDLGDRVEVEDLVQETFLRAWKDLKLFRGEGEGSFSAWLGTILRHVVQEYGRRLRAKKVDFRREVPIDRNSGGDTSASGIPANALQANGSSPSQILRRSERFERLKAAINELSPKHRRVILLARVRRLSMEEVAKRMNSSPKAVSALLARALKELQATFGRTVSLNLPSGSLEELEKMDDHDAPGSV